MPAKRFIWIRISVDFSSTPQLSHGENNSNGPNTVLYIVEDRGWTITSVPFWKQQADNNCYFRMQYKEDLAIH